VNTELFFAAGYAQMDSGVSAAYTNVSIICFDSEQEIQFSSTFTRAIFDTGLLLLTETSSMSVKFYAPHLCSSARHLLR